jgi:hypothetical protein
VLSVYQFQTKRKQEKVTAIRENFQKQVFDGRITDIPTSDFIGKFRYSRDENENSPQNNRYTCNTYSWYGKFRSHLSILVR